MCCLNNPDDIKKFLKKHKNHKSITVYKTLNTYHSKLISPFRNMQYHIGWNISDSKKRGGYYKSFYDVHNGIHVYLENDRIWSTVKLKVLIEDLLAINNTHAVFKKAYLSEKEYLRRIGK